MGFRNDVSNLTVCLGMLPDDNSFYFCGNDFTSFMKVSFRPSGSHSIRTEQNTPGQLAVLEYPHIGARTHFYTRSKNF